MDRGLRTGHLLSLGGALAVGGSLWMPWYGIRLDAGVRGALTDQATRLPPALSELAKGLVQVLPEEVHGTGWDAFHGADTVLFGGAVLVLLAILIAAGVGGTAVRVTAPAAGRFALAAGLALGALVLVKILNPVGPNDLVSVDTGAWLALGGCALMAAGGLLASHEHTSAVPPGPVAIHIPAASPGWSGSSSVAPPPHH